MAIKYVPRDGRPSVCKDGGPKEERCNEEIGINSGRLNERSGNGTENRHPDCARRRSDEKY